jgi:hypothetical protein
MPEHRGGPKSDKKLPGKSSAAKIVVVIEGLVTPLWTPRGIGMDKNANREAELAEFIKAIPLADRFLLAWMAAAPYEHDLYLPFRYYIESEYLIPQAKLLSRALERMLDRGLKSDWTNKIRAAGKLCRKIDKIAATGQEDEAALRQLEWDFIDSLIDAAYPLVQEMANAKDPGYRLAEALDKCLTKYLATCRNNGEIPAEEEKRQLKARLSDFVALVEDAASVSPESRRLIYNIVARGQDIFDAIHREYVSATSTGGTHPYPNRVVIVGAVLLEFYEILKQGNGSGNTEPNGRSDTVGQPGAPRQEDVKSAAPETPQPTTSGNRSRKTVPLPDNDVPEWSTHPMNMRQAAEGAILSESTLRRLIHDNPALRKGSGQHFFFNTKSQLLRRLKNYIPSQPKPRGKQTASPELLEQ